MTIKDFKFLFFSELKNTYPKTEIQSFYYLLIQHKLKLSKVEIALQPLQLISYADTTYLKNAILELKKEKPIQYIIGETVFYQLTFKVNSHTLIPRPETEELVDWIISDCTNSSKKNILDIGTGSGCIAISLAKNLPKANVLALDFCKNALQTAKENAELNKCGNISFLQKDILHTKKLPQKLEVIVSNPPYVRNSEKKKMQKNVLNFEPKSALFVSDENPLIFYEQIGKLAIENLTKNGVLYFEINQYLKNETKQLLKNIGFTNITVKKDIYQAHRMLKASF